MRRYIQLLTKWSIKRTLIKGSHYIIVVPITHSKTSNSHCRISVPLFQKQPSATVLQGRCSFKVFLWILRNITAFFIEHIRWLLLRFTSTFENYPLVAASAFCQHFWNSHWDDLSVILFTLTHPSKRLNTCLRLITEKVDQGVKSV